MGFHYVNTCFICVIISRTEYSFLSKQTMKIVPQRAVFLSLNRISELIWDIESYEARAPSDSSSEKEGKFEDKPGVSHLQPDRPRTTGHESSSSYFFKFLSWRGNISEWAGPNTIPFAVDTVLCLGQKCCTRIYCVPRAQKGNETPHIKWRLQST